MNTTRFDRTIGQIFFTLPVFFLLCTGPVLCSQAAISVTPADQVGNDGRIDHVIVETTYYKAVFDLDLGGSADSLIYKPLQHDLRAENYYSSKLLFFRDFIRLAEPDPITGLTRPGIDADHKNGLNCPATWKTISQNENQLTLEFARELPKPAPAAWFEKIMMKRRMTFFENSPRILVEVEVNNYDTQPHPVLITFFNSVNLGRVATNVVLPSTTGKLSVLDPAEERSSNFIYNPMPSDRWIGGINAEGFGAAFSYDWADIDCQSADLWKTVGATYEVHARRREIAADASIMLKYQFMPFSSMLALDGMADDLAGGVLVGEGADYHHDVATTKIQPNQKTPAQFSIVSGSPREVIIKWKCVRQEDGISIADEKTELSLPTGKTAFFNASLPLGKDGLYVLTATVDDGHGTILTMQKPIEVGRTRLQFTATLPPGNKRGVADASLTLGPTRADEQFRTIDRNFSTPHLPMLTNHMMGPVKVFFATPADQSLGYVREITERGDFDFSYLAMTKVANPNFELNQLDLRELLPAIRKAEPQVMVSLALDWEIGFKRDIAKQLLDRVRDGMGLVVMAPDLKSQITLSEALQDAREMTDEPLAACAVDAVSIKRYQLGKGRIVLIVQPWNTYRDGVVNILGGWTKIHTASGSSETREIAWHGYEYSLARLAQMTRWAANQETPIIVTDLQFAEDKVQLSLVNLGPACDCNVQVTARSRRWQSAGQSTQKITIAQGPSQVVIPLENINTVGKTALEATLFTDKGKVIAYGSGGVTIPSPATLAIKNEPIYRRPSQPGSVIIEYSSKVAADYLLNVDITDRFGRLVKNIKQTISVTDQIQNITLDLANAPIIDTYHDVVATMWVAQSGKMAGDAWSYFILTPERAPWLDQFLIGTHGAPERSPLALQADTSAAQELGIVLRDNSYFDPLLYSTGGYKLGTTSVAPTKSGRWSETRIQQKIDSKNLTMTPPLFPSAAALAAGKQAWIDDAKKSFTQGAWMIQIDDERRLSGDFDFSPKTLDAFRQWIANRYASIDALNHAWGSHFADFSAVIPIPRAQLPDKKNMAPWLEFRMFIGYVIGEYYMKAPSEWATQIDPQLAVGEWGIYEPDSNLPVDWSKYAKYYHHTSRYGDRQGVLEELFRCFAPQSTHGQWLGYGMIDIKPGRRAEPWLTMLNGGHHALYWELREPGFYNYAVLTSDQRPTQAYTTLAHDEWRDITGGIDRLIFSSHFTDDGIAFGYSYPSWIVDDNALAKRSKTIVEELGYQHRFINLEGIDAAQLKLDGIRLLIIESARCLSHAQEIELEKYASLGGTLLLIHCGGDLDEHGAPHDDGSVFDHLAGLDSQSGLLIDRPGTMEFKPGKSAFIHVGQSGVKTTTAIVLQTALVDDSSVPMLTERKVGAGKVLWLNSTLGGHRVIKNTGVAGELSTTLVGTAGVRAGNQTILDAIVAEVGIKRRLQISKNDTPIFDTESWYHQSPSGKTMLVSHYLMNAPEDKYRINLLHDAVVYDIRKHQLLGSGSELNDQFTPGIMHVYGLLNQKLTRMELVPSANSVHQGERVHVKVNVFGEKSPADLTAVRISVSGPDAKSMPAYQRVVTVQNEIAEFELVLPFNHPVGITKISGFEIIAGLGATTEIQVVP